MSRRFAIALCIGLASMACAVSAQTYYKWTDASGVVHYANEAPRHGKAEQVRVGGAAAPRALPANPATTAAPAAAASAPTSALDQAQAEYERQSCVAAQRNLALLQSGKMVLSGDPAEDARRLNDTQRSKAKADAKARIARYCHKGKTS